MENVEFLELQIGHLEINFFNASCLISGINLSDFLLIFIKFSQFIISKNYYYVKFLRIYILSNTPTIIKDAIKELPPAETKGKGKPVTGIKPKFIPILIIV